MAEVAYATHRGTILVVEDRDDVRHGLSELLELNGFSVLDARDGEQALARLDADPGGYALILLDLVLPGRVSGTDLRRRQLADAVLSSIPTIVITACDMGPEERQPLHPAAWLDKPYRMRDLLALVNQYVG
jgi:DNA-binding response OmpR family regulator